MNLDYIDKLVDTDKYYLYYKNKPILYADNFKKLEREVKDNISAPAKETQVFVVHFGKSKNKNRLFVVNCRAFTITTKLYLVAREDDYGQSITYSDIELNKKFKKWQF